MLAAPPSSELPKNKQMTNDLKEEYKNILEKHLDGRTIKEDKITSWMNNILEDAKEYFVKKYQDYDLFLYVYVCPRTVYFYSYTSSISVTNTDWSDSVTFITDSLYSCLYFFFYKHYELKYEIKEENEIAKKGNEILRKYLQERKYGKECDKYNQYINNEYSSFVINKVKNPRCYLLGEIYENLEGSKYYYNYLSHGKNIISKIIQTYDNDSLTCFFNIFFFK